MKKRVLIFAGTTEGRKLTAYLAGKGIEVHVCTATLYGESLLPCEKNITLSHERLDADQMKELMKKYEPDFVIDATHPHAKEVTANVKEACETSGFTYMRLVRERDLKDREENDIHLTYVESVEEAVEALRTTEGNILVTTGSKELERYTELPDYKERIYARVLSVEEAVAKCEKLGIRGRHLICMQGPFSTELNRAVMKEYDVSYLVTKESGMAGGFSEKYQAALEEQVKMIVIGRPVEERGYTYGEIVELLKNEYCLQRKQKISILGIGMGQADGFTLQARKACEQADVIIGARRMAEASAKNGKPVYISYKAEEIVRYIKEHPEYERVAVVFSGDIGFYSGAGKVKEQLEVMAREEHMELEMEMIPGVSSISYFCAKLGIAWEDATILSVHGKKENVLSAVCRAEKTIILAGSNQDIRDICISLTEAGLGALPVCIGIRLSYEEERILKGKAADYTEYDEEPLAVIYIENPQGRKCMVSHGLPDEIFVRGKVPMTKAEVRSVCLSKMQIQRDWIIYDVGAGTGSVSAEAARLADKGHIYAIERKKEAVELIRENARRMKTDNITIAEGEASEMIRELPPPDCVFIGGSGGRLREIIECVCKKNPKVRIVISAVTLETLAKAVEYCKMIPKTEEEIVQVSIAKARTVGDYHMMAGQNPVFIISFTCNGE